MAIESPSIITASDINTALGGKANSSHTHTISEITNFPSGLFQGIRYAVGIAGYEEGDTYYQILRSIPCNSNIWDFPFINFQLIYTYGAGNYGANGRYGTEYYTQSPLYATTLITSGVNQTLFLPWGYTRETYYYTVANSDNKTTFTFKSGEEIQSTVVMNSSSKGYHVQRLNIFCYK